MYSTLQMGSTGEEVKKLQQTLSEKGQTLDADGIFGTKTQNAVRSYQQANHLAVDGIVGPKTWASLLGSTGSADSGQETVTPKPQPQQPEYDPSYDQQLTDIYEKLMNREDFQYDFNADPLYRQYRDQYIAQGQAAMQDTMGQAAALTGGYGNSYGQSVAQQQYQGYLQQLSAVIPELYGNALDSYTREGEALYNRYALLSDLTDREYGRYQDAMSAYWQEKSYGDAQQEAAYSKLTQLITSAGYSPTDQELSDAGMTRQQANALASYYTAQNTPKYTYSGKTDDGFGEMGMKKFVENMNYYKIYGNYESAKALAELIGTDEAFAYLETIFPSTINTG